MKARKKTSSLLSSAGQQDTKFKSGAEWQGNSKGRPKGSTNRYSISELSNGIKAVEKKKRKKFIEAWIEAAWGDAKAMEGVMSFMAPRLKSVEVTGVFSSEMTITAAKSIQDKMKKRFDL